MDIMCKSLFPENSKGGCILSHGDIEFIYTFTRFKKIK